MIKPSPDFQRVAAALDREEPDRVPLGEFLIDPPVKEAFLGRHVGNSLTRADGYDVAADVEFWYRAGYDYMHLAPNYLGLFTGGWNVQEGDYSLYDEAPVQKAWMEEHRSVIRAKDDVESYPWPDPDEVDLSDLVQAANLLPRGMKLTSGTWGIFETTRALLGFEGAAYALYDQPGLVESVLERVGDFLFRLFLRVLELPNLGALWFADDLSSVDTYFVNPNWYRQHLFPWMTKYNEAAAAKGLPLIYHCDGTMWEVLPDIVECGFAAIQPVEPKAMDIVEVKRQYGRHLCLIGNIDLGGSLTMGTPQQVGAEVHQRISELAQGGGYMVGSSNSITSYVPLENYKALIEAVFKWGWYPVVA
ncbi:MAG: uroporphyrinogen decarboxylase family protein [Armatimonadia bacterium]